MKNPKHYAWFVFNTTDEVPLLFTAAFSRVEAINRFETRNISNSPLAGRKVRKCEIVPVARKRRAKK